MIYLLNHASLVITDSGDFKRKHTGQENIVLHFRETTWPETAEAGWNTLVGLDTTSIRSEIKFFDQKLKPNSKRTEIYGAPEQQNE